MTLLEQWLFKAEQDLGSAQLLLDGKFYGTAFYTPNKPQKKLLKPTASISALPYRARTI
jgi:hypothetical protein